MSKELQRALRRVMPKAERCVAVAVKFVEVWEVHDLDILFDNDAWNFPYDDFVNDLGMTIGEVVAFMKVRSFVLLPLCSSSPNNAPALLHPPRSTSSCTRTSPATARSLFGRRRSSTRRPTTRRWQWNAWSASSRPSSTTSSPPANAPSSPAWPATRRTCRAGSRGVRSAGRSSSTGGPSGHVCGWLIVVMA